MGSLSTCLHKAGSALRAEDKAAIIERTRALRGEGKSVAEAAALAIDEQIAALEAMLSDAGPKDSGPRQVAEPTTPYGTGPIFYSELARQVERASMNAAPANAWKDWIKGLTAKGVKPDEIAWSGIEEFLSLQTGKVTKAQVSEFLAQNGVQVTETVLSDQAPIEWTAQRQRDGTWQVRANGTDVDTVVAKTEAEAINQVKDSPNLEDLMESYPDTRAAGTPKFNSPNLVLPGGTNYREVLLTLPRMPGKQGVPRKAIFDKYAPDIDAARLREQAALNAGDDAALRAATDDADMLMYARGREAAAVAGEMPEYKSGHWDQPNVLAHIRLNDRVSAPEPYRARERSDNFQRSEIAALLPLDVVESGVAGLVDHDQVRAAVVAAIPVDVVDMLARLKIAPESLFGNKSVKADLARASLGDRLDVLSGMVTALGKTEASLRAKVRRSLAAGRDEPLLPALRTSDLSRVEVTRLLGSDQVGSADALKAKPTGAGARAALTGARDAGAELTAADRAHLDDLFARASLGAEARSGGLVGRDAVAATAGDANLLDAHDRIVADRTRTDADGKRVLFVEELQSDWGQQGKRVGFKDEGKIREAKAKADALRGEWEAANRDLDASKLVVQKHARTALAAMGLESYQQIIAAGPKRAELTARYKELQQEPEYAKAIAEKDRLDALAGDLAVRMGEYERGHGQDNTVPLAPLVTHTDKWVALALKRVVKMAVDGGYDRVAFVTGEQSAERYSLSKQVHSIKWEPYSNGTTLVSVFVPDQNALQLAVDKTGKVESARGPGFAGMEGKGLDDIIGKDVAKRILEAPKGELAGEGLNIGGEGMKAFYDKIVPSVLKDVLRKVGGGQLGTVQIRGATNAHDYFADQQGGFSVINGKDEVVGRFDTQEKAAAEVDRLNDGGSYQSQPGFSISPSMREKAAGGMALFEPTNGAYNSPDGQADEPSRVRGPESESSPAGPTPPAAGRPAKPGTAADDTVRGAGEAVPSERLRVQELGIAADIKRTGSAALVGRTVESADDLAELAQVYRDPRYETFRIFYVKAGVIVHATGVSARMPAFTPMVPDGWKDIEYTRFVTAEMDRTGADSYYLLHNHPTGNPTPSAADERLTGFLSANVPGFVAHVVINSNKYAVIDTSPHDGGTTTRVVEKDFGPDLLLQASTPSPVLGRKISAASDLVALGKSFQKPGWVTLIGTGTSDNKVRVIAEAPSSILSRPPSVLAATVRRMMRLSGAGNMHLVGSSSDIATEPVRRAIEHGILRDAIGDSGRTMRDYGVSPRANSFANTAGRSVAEPEAGYGKKPPPPKQRTLPLRHEPGWSMPEGTGFDNFVYKFQDKHVDLKRAIGRIKSDVKLIADKWDAYLQEELFHGRAAKRTQDFTLHELAPLMTDMAMRDLSLEDLGQYLHARHAKEANILAGERNPDDPVMRERGSGKSDKEAKDYMDGLDPAVKKRLEAVAAKVDTIIEKTRNLYAAYGLESQATVDGWGAMFKHYVPLQREDKDGGMGIGQGFSIRGPEARHRTGSTAKVVDILANIAMQREKAIVRGEKNRVAVALAGLVKMNPNDEVWTFGEIPTMQVLNEATGLVETIQEPRYKSDPNVLVAKIMDAKGEVHERVIVFNEHNERAVRMAKALKNLDAMQLEGWVGVSAKITRYFSAINTQYNPVFGVVNFTRDVGSAALNLSSTELAGRRLEIMGHALPALAGIYRDARQVRKDKTPTSKWAALWEEFQNEGGQTGFRDLYATSEDRADAMKAMLDPTNWMKSNWGRFFTAGGLLKVPLAIAQKGAKPIFDWLSDYNLAMENAVRLSAYKVGLDHSMTKQRAASLAKNLTVNFNRKGQAGQQVGALYAFFNASMQGTARMGEVMFSVKDGNLHTMRLTKAGASILAGGVMLGVAQAVVLAAMGFDDDEPPQFVRERNLIIPLGGKRYVTVPMPLGWHVIPNMGRISAEYALGGFKNPGKKVTQLIGVMIEAFNPIGSAGISGQTIAPTPLDPIVALLENKDWTGRPIAKESRDPSTPGHKLAKDVASGPSRMLAEAINSLTGGTKHVAGMLSPTPDQLDYLWAQITGGVGRELSKAEQSVRATVSGEDLPPHKIPLVGRFYGNADNSSGQASRFYESLRRINEHDAEIKGLKNKGKAAEITAYQKGKPETALTKAADEAEAAVRKLRKFKSDALNRGAPRAEVKKLEDAISARMKAFNDLVKSTNEPQKKAA